jgi:hypothetical protein
MAEEGAQLEIQQQINKLLQDRQALMAASAKQLQDQTQIAMQLCAALKCESLEGMTEQLEGMSGALTEAADAAEKPKNSLESVADAAGGLASKLDASKVAAVGAGVGLISGFKGGLGMMKSVGKGITGIVGSLGKVGATILATPFKLMSGLVGMAQSGGGGPSPIRQELEAMRGTFGDIASNEGKAVASSLGQIQSQMGDMAGTGLKMSQVYGHGPEGVAAAMKEVHELAQAIGPGLSGMTEMFQKSAVELSMYRKGLGMTADQQANMLKQASMAGKDPVAEMNKFASMAIQMGDQFGVNAKVVGKSMAEMSADVANFGQLSAKELGKAAIFADKLGIKAKELQGVISKFDNFEDAAKGAGEMAQAFGMNVDAMELMNAQNPAERLSMLQKSFKDTGKSVEDMSRQELKMLASQSGLSEEAAKLAFSQKGMSLSYDDISKGGDKAEKKQLSQAEAMDKLAGSIQKMTKGGGGGGFKGFMDAFLSGFGDGIKKSKEFRLLMKNIRKSLKVVFQAGKQVGIMFVKMFPGVKQFLGGLAGIFDPKKFKALMGDTMKVFKTFFGDLSKDPKKATEKFIDNIKKTFGRFFGKQGGAAKDVAEGGSKIMKALKGIFLGLMSVALKGMTTLVNKITEGIKNPKPIKSGLGQMFGDLFSAVIGLLIALVPPLLKALKGLATTVFTKYKPQLIKIGSALLIVALSKMFLVATLSALKGAVMGKMVGLIGKAFGKMFGSVAKSPGALKGSAQMGKGMAKGGGLGKGFGSFIKGFAAIKVTDILKAAFKLSIMALSFIPVIKVFAFAAVEAYKVIKSSGPMKVAAGMVALAIAVGAAVVLSKAGQQINAGGVVAASIGLGAGAIMLGVGAVAFSIALKLAASSFEGIDWKAVPAAMIGLAISAGAAVVLSMAGVALNAASGAIPGLMAGALMLGLGAVAFALALGLANVVMGPIDMGSAALNMLALGLAAGSAVLLAMAGVALIPAQAAIPGLLVGAMLVGVGALAFAVALGITNKAMGMVDMKSAAINFGMLVIATLAAVPMAAAATLLIPLGVLGSVGAVIGAGFLSLGATMFAAALQTVTKEMDKVDMEYAALNMGFMALVMIATVPMAIAAAALAIPAVLGMIGIFPAAGFLALVASVLGPALVSFGAMGIDAKKVATNAGAVAAAMGALVVTALTAVLLIPFAVPFIGGWLMKKGIELIGDFMEMIADKLVGPLSKFAAMPIPASASLGQKIDLINAAVEGVGTLGGIAIGLAEIDQAAVEEGGKQGGTIKAVTGFMDVLLGGIIEMIEAIGEVANSVDPSQIGAIKAIASVIEGIGKLIAGVVPPIAELAMGMIESSTEGGGIFSSGKVNTGKFDSMMGSIKGLMSGVFGVMKEQIGPMVKDIVTMDIPGGVEAAQPKIELISKVVGVIGTFLEPMSTVLKMMQEQESQKGFFEKISDVITGQNPADSMMGKLKVIMTGLMNMIKGNLPEIVSSVIAAADAAGDPKTAQPKIALVASAIDIMGKMTSQLFKTLELVKGKNKKPDLGALMLLFGPPGQPKMSVMYMIASSAGEGIKVVVKAILDATKDMNPAVVEPAVRIVSQAIEAVSNFAGAIIDTMAIAMPKGGGLKATEKALPVVLKVISAISLAMADSLPFVIAPILDVAKEIGGSETADKGMKTVSAAIGAVGEFASALKDIMSLVPSDPKAINPDRLKDVLKIVGAVTIAISVYLPILIGSLGKAVKLVQAAKIRTSDVKKVSLLLEGVGKFASAMKDIMSIMPAPAENADPNALGESLKIVGKVAAAATEGIAMVLGDGEKGMIGLAKLVQSSGIKTSSIKKLNSFFTGIALFAEGLSSLSKLSATGDVSSVIGSIAGSITNNKKELGDMIGTLGGLDNKMLSKGATRMKKFSTMMTKSVAPAFTVLEDMSMVTAEQVKSINDVMVEVKSLINTIGDTEMKGVVDLARVLAKPGKNNLTVTMGKPITIKATFNVIIDSKEVGRAIAATGEVAAAGDGTK